MKVTRHPNGFLRAEFFKLPSGFSDRIHIWDKPGLMDGCDIHQHEADFYSDILTGEMLEEIFTYEPDENGTWERWSVVCYTDDKGAYHVDDIPEEVVRVTPVHDRYEWHRAGDRYFRPAEHFHLVTAVHTPLVTRSWTSKATQRRHHFMRELPTIPEEGPLLAAGAVYG